MLKFRRARKKTEPAPPPSVQSRRTLLEGENHPASGQQEHRYYEPSPFVAPFRPEDDPWVWEK